MAHEGEMKRRLGRGLDALLGGFSGSRATAESDDSQTTESLETVSPTVTHSGQTVCVDLIHRNPFQPRLEFDDASLDELADSIRQHGILQPILVRAVEGGFELIAGERRWLAAQRAGLPEVPCRVLELEDRAANEAALEENLKRKDLNVLEKAQAFQDYVKRFECTIEELSKRLSLDRSTVSNMMRLLELPDVIKRLLLEEKITAGHAKALLPLEQSHQIALSDRILSETLSVRETEAAAREILKGDGTPDTISIDAARRQRQKPEPTPHVLSLEQQFRDLLGLQVQIKLKSKDAGQVVIDFSSNDDFERLTRFLRKAA